MACYNVTQLVSYNSYNNIFICKFFVCAFYKYQQPIMKLWKLGVVVGIIAAVLQMFSVEFFIPKSLRLSRDLMPAQHMDMVQVYSGDMPSNFRDEPVVIQVGPLGFILVIRPSPTLRKRYTSDDVSEWLVQNDDWFAKHIAEYGGVLLRGFQIPTVYDFDDLIGQLHRDVNGTGIYLGTAPRVRVPNTRFVSTASEIPRIFSIPTHLELCFTPHPPPRLYFFAEQPNPPPGGQTPFTDFRQVWRDMPEELKERLITRGMVYQRRYYNARPKMRFRTRKAWNTDVMQHKSWQDMYETSNRTLVEEMSREQQFTPTWDTRFNLLLTHPADVFKIHPVTQEPYFSTHFNVLHASTHIVPYLWDAQLFNSKKTLLLGAVISLITQLRVHLAGYPYGHDVIHADTNTSVSFEDGVTIRKLILKNTWQFDWLKNDVMLLDNLRIAHGRTPWFEGERRVYVAWN